MEQEDQQMSEPNEKMFYSMEESKISHRAKENHFEPEIHHSRVSFQEVPMEDLTRSRMENPLS